MRLMLLALLACSQAPEQERSGPPDCGAEPHEELRIQCWIARAEQAAVDGDPVGADGACRQVPPGRWAEECAFRAGEELARAGLVVEGVAFCARAQHYARFCLTHVSWRLMPDPDWRPADPATAALPGALVEAASAELSGASEDLRQAGLADLRAGLWFRMYYGHGSAPPHAARAATGPDGPPARTAWCLEATRLLAPWDRPLPPDLWDLLLAAWEGGGPVLTGQALPRERRVGRYSPGVLPRELGEVRSQSTFGGGVRLVADDPLVDLHIACTEALFFRETTPAEALLPWIDDPQAEVRWTAAWRYVGIRRPEPGDLLPFSEHTDPVVRALGSPPKGPGHRSDAATSNGPRSGAGK